MRYAPVVVDEHRVAIKYLDCKCFCDRLECGFAEEYEAFDRNPERHFVIGDEVAQDLAFRIAGLYEAGKIEPRNWLPGWDGLTGDGVARIGRAGSAYHLTVATQACSFAFAVRIDGSGDDQVLRVVGPVEGGCV